MRLHGIDGSYRLLRALVNLPAIRRSKPLLRRAIQSPIVTLAYHTVFRTTSAKEKEDWEFQWQRDNWASLYSDPKNKAKAYEYWVKYRYLEEILKRIVVNDETFILDVGCGISTVLDYLPGHRYGIDPLAERYKSVYHYPSDLDIRTAYGESIPFANSFFDVVVCSNCIDHTSNPKRTCGEIRRVLKPSGHFILTCEIFESDAGRRNVGHPYTMTIEKLRKLVSDFSVIEHWDSPFLGLRKYVLGEMTASEREHILLLRKP